MSVAIQELRSKVFGKGSPLFYKEPLHIVRGEGVELFDERGKRYIDMYNNVPCVGHCHPHVVRSIQNQVAQLNVHNRYLHEGILSYGERLLAKHHDDIECVVFACTGTEANEIAIQMAKVATGSSGFVCSDAAYHGNSREIRRFSRRREPSGEVRSIPFPETYRAPTKDPLDFYLQELRNAIANIGDEGVGFAGMLVCPIFANEGLPNIPKGFMAEASRLVRESDGLMIADEVQAGLGRTGYWWGYESEEFEPDVVTMGKPLGAGVPLSAAAASRDIVEKFRASTGYFNTFASSPLQAAAGGAVLDVFENENLISESAAVGDYMRTELSRLLADHPNVGQVRGKGLFVAIEWVSNKETKEADRESARDVVERVKQKGFLIGNAGRFGNVLKIRPPLVFSYQHAEQFVDAFKEVSIAS